MRLLTLRLLTRCEVLDDDHSNRVVQQNEMTRALIMGLLARLGDDLGDLVPSRIALDDESVRLPTIRAILRS
jgi:hypothetical protein